MYAARRQIREVDGCQRPSITNFGSGNRGMSKGRVEYAQLIVSRAGGTYLAVERRRLLTGRARNNSFIATGIATKGAPDARSLGAWRIENQRGLNRRALSMGGLSVAPQYLG